MSERGLCWCGLGKEKHDGREMDAAGDMHRFQERPRPERERQEVFEDPAPTVPAQRRDTSLRMLKDIRAFLDLQIVRMAENGYKYPAPTVARARELSGK